MHEMIASEKLHLEWIYVYVDVFCYDFVITLKMNES